MTTATTLAFGTAGAQGTGLVAALARSGRTPVRVSTDPARVESWRAAGEVATVADLTDPASVTAAVAASDATEAALHLPLGALGGPGTAAVLASIEALREAGLRVVVNLGTPVPGVGQPDPMGAGETATRLIDLGAVVLTPTAYLENHVTPWATARLVGGTLVYPRPADDEIAWVAAQDVTAAAVAVLAQDLRPQLLALAGPEVLSFTALAEQIGTGLGAEIAFEEVTPAAYGDAMAPFLGPEVAAGVAAVYAGMPRRTPDFMRPDATAAWRTLGVRPTTAAEWSRQVLAPALAEGALHR